jgi:DNA-binding XRE family transcriptional regulator
MIKTTAFGRAIEVERDWRRDNTGPRRSPRRGGKRSETVNDDVLAVIEQLVKARYEAGMTQGEIGTRIGMAQNRISDFENARNVPSLSLVLKYAKALQITVIGIPE